jgi:hypothetical protein
VNPSGEPIGQTGEPLGEGDHVDPSEPVTLLTTVEQASGGFRVVLTEEPKTRKILVHMAYLVRSQFVLAPGLP